MHLFNAHKLFQYVQLFITKYSDCIENTFNSAIKNNYRFSVGSNIGYYN